MTEPLIEAVPNATKQRRLATVTVERPRCPACGGFKLRKYRSITDQGDGSAMYYVRCQDEQCGCRFRLLQE